MLGVDLTKDIRVTSRLFTPPWKPAAVIVGSGIFVLAFEHFGGNELALPVWSSISALLLTVATKWRLRRRAWFWVTMSAFVATHVPVGVFAAQLGSWISVKGFVLLVVLDWLVMTWVLGLAGRIFGEKSTGRRLRHRPKSTTTS